MNSTYAQKSSTVQKAADSKAASVLDSSSQGESLRRHADVANNAAQCASLPPRPNNTGMPDNLKIGIESLSGFSMDDVRVHYNSSKPATVQALAYTQGTDIHVAPGQEKCLPHEAWHVAQQMAGRVSPTTNINGMPVNDNAALEHEADVMGEKAVQCCCVQKKYKLSNFGCGVGQLLVKNVRDFFNNDIFANQQINVEVKKKINNVNVSVCKKNRTKKDRAVESYYQVKCDEKKQLYLIWRKLTDLYHIDREKKEQDKNNIVKVDLVCDGFRTELWYGYFNGTEYDGYIVAHGTDASTKKGNEIWEKISVAKTAWGINGSEWNGFYRSTDGFGFSVGHNDTCYGWDLEKNKYDGDAISKVIAERGRFECLSNVNSDKDDVKIGNYSLSPKEVWGSFKSMLDYRKVASFLNGYFNLKEKDRKKVKTSFLQSQNEIIKDKINNLISSYEKQRCVWKKLTVEDHLPITNNEFIESMDLFGNAFIGVDKQTDNEKNVGINASVREIDDSVKANNINSN